MERKKFLVISAGGSGQRMGADIPKQFLTLGGKAILQMTMEKFLAAEPGIKIVTVLPKDSMQWWRDYCQVRSFNVPQVLVEGGFTRFHSVKNALEKVPDGAVVAVHDGVRPLIGVPFIREMFSRMEGCSQSDGCRALIPVVRTTDTLKYLDSVEGVLREALPAPDRSRIWGAQTPQMFLSEELRAAYGQAYDTSFTDDASVAAAYAIPLSFIEGQRYNIKITTPEDLAAAEALLGVV